MPVFTSKEKNKRYLPIVIKISDYSTPSIGSSFLKIINFSSFVGSIESYLAIIK